VPALYPQRAPVRGRRAKPRSSDALVLCGTALALLLAAAGAQAASQVEVVDDSGNRIVLAAPARRVISVAPHTTELIAEAGALGNLVAVSAFSDYPAPVRQLPVVGTAFGLDLELIAKLHPDLVVAWTSGSGPAQIEALRHLGIPVFLSDPTDLATIATSIERLGVLTGHDAVARARANQFRSDVETLGQRYSARPSVRVFYQVWAAPLMTIGGRQIISSVIRLCGGQNIFAALQSAAPAVEREAVIAADPQVIVSAADREDPDALASWLAWPKVAAVREHHLLTIPADDIARATPRVLIGARTLCETVDAARH
jgi:iron complex transport system substrate-binding protein